MVHKWRSFLRPQFGEPRAEGFRPASKIRSKATPCVEVWQISNLRRLRLGEKKTKKKKIEEQTTGQKYNVRNSACATPGSHNYPVW